MSEKYDVRLPLKLFVSEAPRIAFDLSQDGHLAPKKRGRQKWRCHLRLRQTPHNIRDVTQPTRNMNPSENPQDDPEDFTDAEAAETLTIFTCSSHELWGDIYHENLTARP